MKYLMIKDNVVVATRNDQNPEFLFSTEDDSVVCGSVYNPQTGLFDSSDAIKKENFYKEKQKLDALYSNGAVVNGVRFDLSKDKMSFYKSIADTAPSLPLSAFPVPLVGEDGVLMANSADEIVAIYDAQKQAFMAIAISKGRALHSILQE